MYVDKHLNIFNHYTSNGTIPIENNISRVLAIILEENNFFFYRFIDFINNKLKNEKKKYNFLEKPDKLIEKKIGFQIETDTALKYYEGFDKIIGMTLTTSQGQGIVGDIQDDSKKTITDITIQCKDVLIVIEVKRNNSPAEEQLQKQINKIVEKYKSINERDIEEKATLSCEWQEIIYLLQSTNEIYEKNQDILILHYLEHLENKYPTWFPVKRIENKDDIINENIRNKRIERIIQNYNKKFLNDEGSNKFISITDSPYFQRVLLDFNPNEFLISIWIGDTIAQAKAFFKNDEIEFSEREHSFSFEDKKYTYKLDIKPYIRFAHFSSTVFFEDLPDKKDMFTKKEELCNIFHVLAKKWKRDEWDTLKDKIKNEIKEKIFLEIFRNNFKDYFEESKRNYVDVCLGYKMHIKVPIEYIIKLEKNNDINSKEDKLASFVKTVFDEFIKKTKLK